MRSGAEPGHHPRGRAEREGADGQRHRQERQAGVPRAVAEDVLDEQRAEHPRAEHAGDEEAAHDARADQRARAQHPQREDRVLDPRLEADERGEQDRRRAAEAERVR